MNDQLTEVYASIDALIDYALAHLDLDPRNAKFAVSTLAFSISTLLVYNCWSWLL